MRKIVFGAGLLLLLLLAGCTGMELPEQLCVKHNGIEATYDNGTFRMPPAMYEITRGSCPVECPIGFICNNISKLPDEAIIQEAHMRILKAAENVSVEE